MAYKKILLALDLSDNAELLCDKAQELSRCFGATLGLIHVVEPLVIEYAYDALPIIPVGIDDELQKRARKELFRIADAMQIAENLCWLEVGATKTSILRIAKENNFELIVIGSHGRHGAALLLGSTANAVLHGAPCDVMAVRIS